MQVNLLFRSLNRTFIPKIENNEQRQALRTGDIPKAARLGRAEGLGRTESLPIGAIKCTVPHGGLHIGRAPCARNGRRRRMGDGYSIGNLPAKSVPRDNAQSRGGWTSEGAIAFTLCWLQRVSDIGGTERDGHAEDIALATSRSGTGRGYRMAIPKDRHRGGRATHSLSATNADPRIGLRFVPNVTSCGTRPCLTRANSPTADEARRWNGLQLSQPPPHLLRIGRGCRNLLLTH